MIIYIKLSRSCNQKCRAIQSRENQTDGLRSKTLILILLDCWIRKQKLKNNQLQCSIPGILIGRFFHFSLGLLQSCLHWIIRVGFVSGIWRKWKHSNSSDFNSLKLMAPLRTPIFDFYMFISVVMILTPSPTSSLVKTRGPFLKSPVIFSGPKSHF